MYKSYRAIDFLVKTLEEDNFDEVHTEAVPNLPRWIRGEDVVEIIGIKKKNFH